MRYDTPISFAESLLSEHKDSIKLSGNKQNVLIHERQLRSWSGLSPYLPPHKELGFSIHCPIAFAELKKFLVGTLLKAKKTELDDDLKNTAIGEDIMTGDMYLIEDGGIQPYHFKSWQRSIPEDQYEMLYENRKFIIVSFNPNKPLSWEGNLDTTTGPKDFDHYNTYVRPKWTYADDPEEYPLCEEFVRPFLDLFLPLEDEKNYVIYWLNCLKFQRNNDVLVLIGTQGNGKNTLMQLATLIAGKHNTIIGSKAFGRDKFNGEVLKRKLVNLDEYSIKGNSKESLKCFSNDDVTIEVKGGDPIQIENHCSFIVANNSMRSTDFEFKDRRFTCPSLNEKDLLLHWPKDRIAAFKAAMKTSDFEIEFPHWLQKEVSERGLNYPNQMNYITPHFYQIVEASKPEWFKEFKRQLRYKSSVNTQDIYKATRVRVSDSKVGEELAREIEEREFRVIKPYVIAKVVTEEGKTQYISNIYKGDENNVNETPNVLQTKV